MLPFEGAAGEYRAASLKQSQPVPDQILNHNYFLMLDKVTGVFQCEPVTITRNPKSVRSELPEALPVICPHLLLIGSIGEVEKMFSQQRKSSQKSR